MFSPLIIQTWYVCSVQLTMLGDGMALGYASSLLLALEEPDSPITTTVETTSWLVASVGIGCMAGYTFTACLMDNIGRKKTYLLSLLPFVAGVSVTYAATDMVSLICGRILTGLSIGASGTLGPIVIGEFTTPRYRGMFLNMKTASVYMGSLIIHAVGHYVHWRTLSLLCMVPIFFAFCITLTWPESPSWLAQCKQFEESEQIFHHLRGSSAEAKREINDMIKAQNKTKSSKTFLQWLVELARKFTMKNFLKPALVFLFCAILLETSCRHIFVAFAAQIVSKVIGSNSELFLYTLVVDVIMTLSVILSSYLIKIMKLRKLIFSTGVVSCVVLSLACLHLFLTSKGIISKDYNAVPITLFALFFVFANLGCAPVPLALIGEIFPLEHRAVGTSVAGYLVGIWLTIGLKTMPIMLESFGVHGAFAVLALCMAVTLMVLYFILPETKDKTLQEIEEFFKHGRYKEDDEDVNILILSKKESEVTATFK